MVSCYEHLWIITEGSDNVTTKQIKRVQSFEALFKWEDYFNYVWEQID